MSGFTFVNFVLSAASVAANLGKSTKTYLTINAPLILQVQDVIFYAGKTYIGALRGELEIFLALKMVPSVAMGHFGAKKSQLSGPTIQGTSDDKFIKSTCTLNSLL